MHVLLAVAILLVMSEFGSALQDCAAATRNTELYVMVV